VKKALTICLILIVLSPFLLIGGCKARSYFADRAARKAQAERAEKEFQPAIDKMESAIAEGTKAKAYDIDKTIRVIHEIDLALKNKANFKDYINQVAMQDYRDVAPDVLVARKQITGVLMKVYAKQIEADHQASAWDITSNFLLSSIAGLKFDLGGGLTGGFGVDRALVKTYLSDLKAKHEKETEMLLHLDALENELINAVTAYAEVYHKHIDEWDKLCASRDHAYIAANNGDWATVQSSAGAAIEQAPKEREAHLLKAMALIEQAAGNGEPVLHAEGGKALLKEAQAVLEDYEKNHPGSTAPALLLRANIMRNQGDLSAARNHYEHAASYYPKQAGELTDMLNPYAFRTFLRKSREGNYILHQYKSTMLGAGYFSPDLQMARMLYGEAQTDAANAKVLDHFSRRRTQEQWDFIVADIEFCRQIMGLDYERIFPPDGYIDLIVNKSRTSAKRLSVALHNRSDRDLHNCTLVLCINFSDMHRADYHTMTVGNTLPLLPAGEQVDFGTAPLQVEILDKVKTAADIVTARAVLVSNEAVIWVDTDEHKVARIMLDHNRRIRENLQSEDTVIKQSAVTEMLGQAKAQTTSSIGKDDLNITLPQALAIIEPIFRLTGTDKKISPDVNLIDNDKINLSFKNIANFDDKKTDPGAMSLQMYSPKLDASAKLNFKRVGDKMSVTVEPVLGD
jgi:tetratricopeptide (TPR) repeat protein